METTGVSIFNYYYYFGFDFSRFRGYLIILNVLLLLGLIKMSGSLLADIQLFQFNKSKTSSGPSHKN